MKHPTQNLAMIDLVVGYCATPKTYAGDDTVAGVDLAADGVTWEATIYVQATGVDPKTKQAVPVRFEVRLPLVIGRPATKGEQRLPFIRLGPGVWKPHGIIGLQPGMASYVTITGCPDPAPWDQSNIVLAS
jgi:hypothetical protein